MDIPFIKQHPAYALALIGYGFASLTYAITWRSRKKIFAILATSFMIFAWATNSLFIINRWIQIGKPPFQSLFETMVFLAFCSATIYLLMEKILATRMFGFLIALGCLSALIYALIKSDAEFIQLPPALQSGWFVPHVVVYFFGYGALFFATVVSLVQLFKPNIILNTGSLFHGEISLEKVSLQTIRFGFVLLTFGLLVGSIWAKSAWGDFWVWDPKENWSLVSWLVYAAYLHLTFMPKWRGRRSAWLAIGGFTIIMFTYLGMNVLPSAEDSVHVYSNQSGQ